MLVFALHGDQMVCLVPLPVMARSWPTTADPCAAAVAGPLAIGISFVAAGLAAANLLLDMDWIEKASYQRLPKWMEWYGAQSLMLTLVGVCRGHARCDSTK